MSVVQRITIGFTATSSHHGLAATECRVCNDERLPALSPRLRYFDAVKKLHFIPRSAIPRGASSSDDCVRQLEDTGYLDPVYEELARHPGGVVRTEAGFRGIYLWVEYPGEPTDITAFGTVVLLIGYAAVFALIGLVLSYLDAWLFGAQPRTELFAIRGAFFGGIATAITFVANRFDRLLFFSGFVVCATTLVLGITIPLWLLVSRDDVAGVLWLLFLAFLHRAALMDWS